MATFPPPPQPPPRRREDDGKDAGERGRAGLGARRAGGQMRGGGKASAREDEAASDPLLDRNAGRRDRGVWRRTRRANMLASLRSGGPWFLPRSPVARMLLAIVAILLLVLLLSSARAEVGKDGFVVVPPYAARVTDQASMLTAAQRSSLEGVLADYEARSGSQIAVLLVPSTAPESIEQYGIRVAEAWKLGRKGVDDGVLLLVAKDNPSALRRLRIEAGRGVQGSLTDAQSKRVLQDVIAPHFRQGDFYGGLAAGVSAIATLVDKERLPAPPVAQPDPGATQERGVRDSGGGGFGWLLPLVFVAAGFFLLKGGGRSARALHRGGWGRDATGVLIGAALGHAMGNRGGGFGGFGGSGGGFGGGGGFSGGGGGTFDGGGASGDW